MNKGPSLHLTWADLACRDQMRTCYPLDWRAGRLMKLVDVFEAIREAAGNRPVHVLSAYRTAEHNLKVGGSPNSMHLHGKALDLAHEHIPAAEFGDLIRQLAATTIPDIGGVGQYETFVHVDIRPRVKHGNFAIWEGK